MEQNKGPFSPERKPRGGRPAKSSRDRLNAILYWLNTGIPRRGLPERCGLWETVYSQVPCVDEEGVWDNAFHVLIAQDPVDGTTIMPDSATVKVHRHGSGAVMRKPDAAGEGLTTKVHMVTNGPGSPLRFLLTGGNRSDVCVAKELPELSTRWGKQSRRIKAVTAAKSSNGWKGGEGSPSFPAASPPDSPGRRIGPFIKNAI